MTSINNLLNTGNNQGTWGATSTTQYLNINSNIANRFRNLYNNNNTSPPPPPPPPPPESPPPPATLTGVEVNNMITEMIVNQIVDDMLQEHLKSIEKGQQQEDEIKKMFGDDDA